MHVVSAWNQTFLQNMDDDLWLSSYAHTYNVCATPIPHIRTHQSYKSTCIYTYKHTHTYIHEQEVQEGHKDAQNVLLQRIASLETSLNMANESYAEAAQMRSKLREKQIECSDLQVWSCGRVLKAKRKATKARPGAKCEFVNVLERVCSVHVLAWCVPVKVWLNAWILMHEYWCMNTDLYAQEIYCERVRTGGKPVDMILPSAYTYVHTCTRARGWKSLGKRSMHTYTDVCIYIYIYIYI